MTSVARNCSVEGCKRGYHSQGFCRAHHARFLAGKPMDTPVMSRNEPRRCGVEGCDRSVKAKGLCGTHYERKRIGRDVTAPVRGRGKKCEVPDCARVNRSKGLCATHRATAERYKLTTQEIIRRDSGICDLCGGPPVKGRSLHVDHDHECCAGDRTCGKCNRGFLCQSCNMGLGSFKDSPELLIKAVKYLREGAIADLSTTPDL